MFSGGREYKTSRMDDGSKNSRWVSKKPTDKKNGVCSWARSAMSFVAAGATSLTRVVSRSATVVVTQVVGIGGDVLLADQAGPVTRLAQHVDHVALGVAQPIAAVGQAEHPRGARALAGQHRGP